MSRIHKRTFTSGLYFCDTINQEYIYLPSGEVGTDHPLAVLETPQNVRTLRWTKQST